MKAEWRLEQTEKELAEIDQKYPGGFAVAQLPSLNLRVSVEGTPEQVYRVKTILRRHYILT